MTLLAPRHRLWRRAARIAGRAAVWAFVLAGAGIGAREVAVSHALRLQEVVVEGNVRVSDVAIRHLADLRTGTHLALADLSPAAQAVERHPRIASAHARRVFPGAVVVHVEEHATAMLLAVDELWAVDASGRPFSVAAQDELDHPVLTGLPRDWVEDRPREAQAVIRGALRLVERADEVASIGRDTVSEVHFDRHQGYALVLRGGTRLHLGYGDPRPGLERLAKMQASGLDLSVPQRIDLEGERLAVAVPLPTHPLPGRESGLGTISEATHD